MTPAPSSFRRHEAVYVNQNRQKKRRKEDPPLKNIRKIRLFRYLRSDMSLYLMVLPAVIGFAIFRYIPIINNLRLGFLEYNMADGIWGSPFVGLKYFRQFFQDPFFGRIIGNTLRIGVYSLLWGFPAPILLALFLNELRRPYFKKMVQSMTYLPYFISTVVIVGILKMMFSTTGVLNSVITGLRLEPISFIDNSSWFLPLYIGSGIWQTAGWSSIIYMAAIAGINQELYEAAYIDGAGRMRQTWHITLPGISPAIIILLITNVGGIIDVGFEKVFLMYSPATYNVADVISTYVYRRGLLGMDFSFAGAVSLFNAVISILLIVVVNQICKKLSDTSLF